ncbi:MAG: hypothetical protein LBQ50_01520 [Planctomycetaceae bacterium]|jgi:hypothetical protein|nr:hypothetical protein [Planctomycetaceae bacterium]
MRYISGGSFFIAEIFGGVMLGDQSRWLFYTVFIGALPMIIRFIAWSLSKSADISMISATELVFFGMILHVSCLTELEHAVDFDKSWKIFQTRMAIGTIIIYSALYAFSLLPNVFSESKITAYSLIFAVFSFFFCRSMFNELSGKTNTKGSIK